MNEKHNVTQSVQVHLPRTDPEPALGPVALRNGGVDLSLLKRWDTTYRAPSSNTTLDEAMEDGTAQLVLILTYRDTSQDEFTGEGAELLLAHLQDHAASSFWRFRPEPPYPTPAERAHQAWMRWCRNGNRPMTDTAFVRIQERCIHEALQADEQRRIRLMQLSPVHPGEFLQAHALTSALENAFTLAERNQQLEQTLRRIREVANQDEVRQLAEAALNNRICS